MDTFYLELPKPAPKPPSRCSARTLRRCRSAPWKRRKPPVRVIVPGKVYRRDNPDATHSFIFHQIEGLAVDTDITFCDFTGTIEYFVKQFFGPGVKTRFRPSYFPFTEPSVEFDVSCVFCGGSGTMRPAAAPAPNAKAPAGSNSSARAWSIPPSTASSITTPKKSAASPSASGIDRLAMLKYGIDDIQVFFQNDVRFLRQFP